MILLGAMFVYGYTLTNALAARSPRVWLLGSAWDRYIPFVGWTLLPYLSINLAYACAFFAFDTRSRLDRFALRVLAVQSVCFAIFFLFPTGTSRTAPPLDGMLGLLYAQLRAFEQPFNMVPSLHVAALVVLWASVRTSLVAPWHGLWQLWCALVLVSTLTTWQHELVDVAAGWMVGTGCLAIRMNSGQGRARHASR